MRGKDNTRLVGVQSVGFSSITLSYPFSLELLSLELSQIATNMTTIRVLEEVSPSAGNGTKCPRQLEFVKSSPTSHVTSSPRSTASITLAWMHTHLRNHKPEPLTPISQGGLYAGMLRGFRNLNAFWRVGGTIFVDRGRFFVPKIVYLTFT